MGRRGLLRVAILRPLSAKVAIPVVAVAVWCLAAALPAPAAASYLVDRNTSHEQLLVRNGTALVIYRAKGKVRRFMAWGAVNAHKPTRARRQVDFRFDYAGGFGRYGKPVWQTFKNKCGPYRGPHLPWLVAACTAPDGSHWAIQKWKRSQANYGLPPATPLHGSRELRLSHWTGPIAKLEAWLDWSYNGRWHHLFGRYTYRGKPVHGYKSTPDGQPLDSYGRVLYLDTYNSRLGPGWKRENGFLARRPERLVLLRVRPASLVGRTAPAGQRRALPHHRPRARRHAGRHVVGQGPARLPPRECRRRGARGGDERVAEADHPPLDAALPYVERPSYDRGCEWS